MTKIVLLTGGVGFIGSHTCVELMAVGWTPVIVDNLANSSEAVLDRIKAIAGSRPEFINADVRDREALNRIFRDRPIDAVVHFAGLKAVGESVADPLRYYENNVAGTGLASLARLSGERTAFGRWRGHLLMGAAALHGFVFQVWLFNPRLGFFGDVPSGPPLLDSLAIAFAAPALVFGAAAARTYRQQRPAARIYAVIAVLSGVTWAFLEIRRLVHGPHLGGDALSIGAAEAIGCSLVLLGLAALIARVRAKGDEPAHPLRLDFAHVTTLARWIAIGFAMFMAGFWSNPCWGVADRSIGGWAPLLGVLSGYGAIVILIALLALDADRAGRRREAELAADSAIVMGLIFAGLVVRASFHGAELSLSTGAGQLETWSYSAVAALMGVGFVVFSRRGGRLFLRAGLTLLLLTTLKVFVVDTASLSGVVRAGSFLALGALLLLGALTARRIARTTDAPAADTSTIQPS